MTSFSLRMSTQIRTPPSFFGTATIGISSAYSLIFETDCSPCCTEALVIESFTHMLASKKVKVFTGNQNTARIAISGSAKLDLHAIAEQLCHHFFRAKYSWNADGFIDSTIKLLTVSVASLTWTIGN